MTKYISPFVQNLRILCGFKYQTSISSSCYLRKELLHQSKRLFSDKPQTILAEGKIQDILKMSFPSAEYIEVRDVSGGCGAMFEIYVITEEFKGLSIVKQHRLVNEALKEEIKDMHGLRIHTASSSNPS